MLSSTAITLLIVEGILRVATTDDFMRREFPPFPWHIHDPILGLLLKPGYESSDVRINRMGFRGPEIEPEKRKDDVRIACLGDSSTFGITQTGDDERDMSSYPEVLRQIAESNGMDHLEVINAGVMGYTSVDGLRQLEFQVLPLGPDIVTVRFGMNDHSWLRWARTAPEPDSAWARWLMRRFYDWRLARIFADAYSRAVALRAKGTKRRSVGLVEFEHNLERFVEESREHGFRLAFIDYPLRELHHGLSPGQKLNPALVGGRSLSEVHEVHEVYQQIVYRVAERHGIPLIETKRALRELDPPGFTDWDLVHPSESGKRKTAEILYERLRALGWLSPKRPPTGGAQGPRARDLSQSSALPKLERNP